VNIWWLNSRQCQSKEMAAISIRDIELLILLLVIRTPNEQTVSVLRRKAVSQGERYQYAPSL
jgi:hypothetical protein